MTAHYRDLRDLRISRICIPLSCVLTHPLIHQAMQQWRTQCLSGHGRKPGQKAGSLRVLYAYLYALECIKGTLAQRRKNVGWFYDQEAGFLIHCVGLASSSAGAVH